MSAMLAKISNGAQVFVCVLSLIMFCIVLDSRLNSTTPQGPPNMPNSVPFGKDEDYTAFESHVTSEQQKLILEAFTGYSLRKFWDTYGPFEDQITGEREIIRLVTEKKNTGKDPAPKSKNGPGQNNSNPSGKKKYGFCENPVNNSGFSCFGPSLFWFAEYPTEDHNKLWRTVFTFQPHIFFDLWTPVFFAVAGLAQHFGYVWINGWLSSMTFYLIFAIFGQYGHAGNFGVALGVITSIIVAGLSLACWWFAPEEEQSLHLETYVNKLKKNKNEGAKSEHDDETYDA